MLSISAGDAPACGKTVWYQIQEWQREKSETERKKEGERHGKRQRGRGRNRDIQRERDTERDTERERKAERKRETDTERQIATWQAIQANVGNLATEHLLLHHVLGIPQAHLRALLQPPRRANVVSA
jgi:hypothetical protein